MKGHRKRIAAVVQGNADPQLLVRSKSQLYGHLPGQLKITVKPYGALFQHLGGNPFGKLQIIQIQILFPGKAVHGKASACVRSRCNHRYGAADGGKLPGQLIGSAQMAGQKRNQKPSLFIHAQHRRIRCLALHKRSNGADCNSGGPDKEQGILGRKLPLRPFS